MRAMGSVPVTLQLGNLLTLLTVLKRSSIQSTACTYANSAGSGRCGKHAPQIDMLITSPDAGRPAGAPRVAMRTIFTTTGAVRALALPETQAMKYCTQG